MIDSITLAIAFVGAIFSFIATGLGVYALIKVIVLEKREVVAVPVPTGKESQVLAELDRQMRELTQTNSADLKDVDVEDLV